MSILTIRKLQKVVNTHVDASFKAKVKIINKVPSTLPL